MEAVSQATQDEGYMSRAVEVAIRIGVLLLVVVGALAILRPFVNLVLWSIVLAVAVHPLFERLAEGMGGRRKLAASLLTLVALAALLVPSWRFFAATFDEARTLAARAAAGELAVPPPPERVRDWPLVGERAYEVWKGASQSLGTALRPLEPQLEAVGRWALSALAGIAATVAQFLLSILIAGVLLSAGEKGTEFSEKFARRLAGPSGPAFVRLATATTRSVFQGVLGIALIQSALAAVGMLVLGVPAAMLWALLVLILAVMQLPPLLVLGPVMVWAFATQGTVAAVIFLVYGVLVSVSDSFLKPLLLGRGVDVPMLVILLGAIGGMFTSGLLGLFTGAVLLAIAYQLLMAWIEMDADRGLAAPAPPPARD